ncbi:TrkA family potassium uptake protein [Thermodesulfobacterium sp.]|uniref:potassium channel family protein n=1 Tax=Thermodesulfobacterium sp. TaxID=1965289 RepID=UPI002647D798|nr:potassium channel protein [Thermodesulfobacterium sp.]MDN5379541.1 voltage-gated potassium channel [Thermodesulfobacterium sp.]
MPTEYSYSIGKRLFFILTLFWFLIGLGTVGYMVIEELSFLDALYMTVITLATVGFREVKELSEVGKVFTIVLIVLGFGVFTYAATTIAQILIEGELKDVFNERRRRKMLEKLRGHYIICGYGRMGRIIAKELKANGKEVVVIEKNLDPKEEGYLFVIGDATKDEILKEAGIEKAKGLVSVLSSDSDNLYVVLSARALNPDLFIIARAAEESARKKLKMVGANKVVCPYHIGGLRMAHTILKPNVVDFWEFITSSEYLNVDIEEIYVSEKSPYAGKTLKEAEIGKIFGVIIVGIKRREGKIEFNPSAESYIMPGDILLAIGPPDKLELLEKEMTNG